MFIRISNIIFLIMYDCINFYLYNLFLFITKKDIKERLNLIKKITSRLENLNIVYIKIFQSLCLEHNLLNENEKNYLIKYVDNVPYKNNELDLKVLDKLEEDFNIYVENKTPINSGIVGVVFKGIQKKNDSEKKIVVKMLKNNIKNNYEKALEEIEWLANLAKFIPKINTINYEKIILDNKNNILQQTDFKNECLNIKYFYEKFENHDEYIIPEVFQEVTDKYNNIIVMSDISGLTYNDIKLYDNEIKYQMAKILIRFGLLGTLIYGCVHVDLHAGNLFFYIDDNGNEKTFKLGIIDFGNCSFQSEKSLEAYFKFFYDVQIKKDYDQIDNLINKLVDDPQKYNNLDKFVKEKLLEELIILIKEVEEKKLDAIFFIRASKIMKKFNMEWSKEFNIVCLSIQVVNTLGKSLSTEHFKIQTDIVKEFVKMNDLLTIN